MAMKLRRGHGKWILRQVLRRYVPEAMTDRPKMGFGLPLGEWLCGPLREWAGDLLAAALVGRQGILEPEPIARKWREHLDGTRDWQHDLWAVLAFQSWYAAQP